MGKITGVGGAFLKAKDPKALYAWYEQHLGIRRADHGSFVFEKSSVTGATVLAFFPEDSDHFGPGGQRAMLNFRVDDLDGLMTPWLPRACRSTPSVTPTTITASSAGSPIPKATGLSCGSRWGAALETDSGA